MQLRHAVACCGSTIGGSGTTLSARTCHKEQRPTTPRKLRAWPSPCYRGTSGQEPWQDLGRAIIRHHSKNEYLTRLQFDGGLCGVAVHVVNMQENRFHGDDATCSVTRTATSRPRFLSPGTALRQGQATPPLSRAGASTRTATSRPRLLSPGQALRRNSDKRVGGLGGLR